ncbi:unnamed protein product [Phytophthora fragariaefolia]|uniref:Unnamed protein product n=1 Tax=Phytophthora fragariaefolia TaxID=1490495 RepID=A0A9W6XLK6_9STRA|nr:unnamed protein product [Phytophthora fragariaefolia]
MEDISPGLERTALAEQEVSVEKEEYDKELEYRMFPLDEVELQGRVKKNAEEQKEPSIEQNIGKNGSRTRSRVPRAKRANRDFKVVETRAMKGVPEAAEVAYEDFGLSRRKINAREDQQEQNKRATMLVTEADVLANIGAPLECVSGAALSVSPETTKEEIDSSVMRFIARLTVYEMLEDYKNGELVTEGVVERAPDLNGKK